MTTSRSFCVMGKHLYYCLYRTHVILIFHLPLGRKFRRTSSVLNICTPPLPTPTIYPLAKESIPLGSGLFQLLVQTKRFCHCQGVNANDYMELNRLYALFLTYTHEKRTSHSVRIGHKIHFLNAFCFRKKIVKAYCFSF